jgi:hypothetical protein
MMKSRIVLVAAALVLSACSNTSHPDGPGVVTGIQVDAGREFEISAGQEAQVRGTPLTVRFVGVSNESRCPSDVQCVWAGNAVVNLTIAAAGTSSSDAALNTTLDPKSAVFAGYRVTLTGLKPYPRSGAMISAGSYVATLEVRAVQGG